MATSTPAGPTAMSSGSGAHLEDSGQPFSPETTPGSRLGGHLEDSGQGLSPISASSQRDKGSPARAEELARVRRLK